jgi:hypothetical protein
MLVLADRGMFDDVGKTSERRMLRDGCEFMACSSILDDLRFFAG